MDEKTTVSKGFLCCVINNLNKAEMLQTFCQSCRVTAKSACSLPDMPGESSMRQGYLMIINPRQFSSFSVSSQQQRTFSFEPSPIRSHECCCLSSGTHILLKTGLIDSDRACNSFCL